MAFWDDIGRNVGNFFGGIFGGNDKKKEEERQNNFNRPSSSRPTLQVQNAPQNQPKLEVQKPKNLFDTQTGISSNLKIGTNNHPQNKLVVQDNRSEQKKELDRLYQANLAKAQEDAKRQDEASAPKDFFGKFWRWTGADGSRDATKTAAETMARNRAAQQYQDKHGWNADKEVINYTKGTSKIAQDASKRSQDRIENTKKTIDVIRYIPGAGLGELGANAIRGNFSGSKEADDTLLREQMDLTQAEVNSLSPEDRGKYLAFAKGGLGAGVLDLVGLGAGSVAKSAAKGGVKQAIKMGARTNLRNVAREAASKEGAKMIAKNLAVGGVAGAGISGGGAKLMGADDQAALEAAGRGFLGGMLGAGASSPLDLATTSLARTRNAKNSVRNALEVGDAATNIDAAKKTAIKVQQPREIDVTDASGEMTNIPVRDNNTKPTPIKEVGGDTPGVNQIKVPTAEEKIAQRLNDQPSANPDKRIEGIVPYNTGNTGDFTRAEIQAEKDALEVALKNGEINRDAYLAANEQLSQLRAIDDPTPEGTKITVKQVQDIPVVDKTEVPVGLPETPGTVRATVSSSPNAAKTAQAARRQVVLPPETQAVLDNPRKFSKAQVAAARNQRKLAMQMAKTQEQTAEALARIESASPAAQTGEGFVPTGEFGKSVNGGAYQKVSRSAEMAKAVEETANLSPGDVLQTARANASQNGGGFNRRDIRNIAALFETKRLQRGTPEWNEARQILKEDGTNWGQAGALRNYTMRRNASSDELISRFESKLYRLADDPSKIDSKLFDQVDAAETNFVETRDAATRAYNAFTQNPTNANAKAYHAAQDAADKADVAAKQVEYTVANQALKGNKDIQQARELEKMAQSADMYQMDAVDASMLSGTGTFVRNFVNASVGGIEEGLFGKTGARVSSLITKQDVGGGAGRGTMSGFKKGAANVVDASKARARAAGKNPIEHLKNWATTGNQLGDSVIDSQATRSTLDHYTHMLKSEGYRGRELRDRASVMARQDPNNVGEMYSQAARVAAGLGSGVTRNNKIETLVKNVISDGISGGNPNKYTENFAKLITRLTLGFPTAIGRSVVEGGKRFTLGAPTFIRAMATKDPQQRAILVKEGIKQAGTGGLVIPPMFYALGASGAITGSYPDSQEERDRWEREGITENSIKIGNDYYQLPAYLGSWAVPGLFYASLGRNGGDWGAAASDVAKAAPDLLPTGGIDSVLDVVNGRKDIGKYMSQLIPSAVRASTPGGALLNQLAKSLDPTKNDTNTGDLMADTVSKIMSGIPVLSNFVPDKTDSEGNVLTNPDPLALGFGAASTEQEAGVQQTQALNEQTNSYIQEMADLGAFSDPNLKAVLTDTDDKKIYQSILAGKQVNPGDLEKLQKAMTKGVSSEGTDTAYLEREQYDTNLAVLNMKRQLMAADPTVRPSSLEKLDVAIKRGEIYRDNEIPYEVIKSYQDTSLTEWRDMGDPESDAYDPEQYQMLWAIDEMMASAGVSYKSGSLDKQKYYAKKSGSGGRGGSKSFSAEFGKLGELRGAPSVQAYDTIERQSGTVPVIQRQRPNIVHKIGFSG